MPADSPEANHILIAPVASFIRRVAGSVADPQLALDEAAPRAARHLQTDHPDLATPGDRPTFHAVFEVTAELELALACRPQRSGNTATPGRLSGRNVTPRNARSHSTQPHSNQRTRSEDDGTLRVHGVPVPPPGTEADHA